MKVFRIILLSFFVSILALTSCEEETTTVGSVLATGEVDITVDTIEYSLNAKALKIESFDSKTGNLMIGSIQSDSYGDLACSFVTRLMCATSLEIPDSIWNLPDYLERVDSCRLILGASRKNISGDSLAPQVMTIYKLLTDNPLPSNISNTFNPEGYYDPNPFASRSYTVSGVAETDSAFYNNTFVDITVDLPLEFGKEIFQEYKENPSTFQWPSNMANNFLQGFYVKPTFGNGCIANIDAVFVAVYYYTLEEETSEDDDGNTVTTVKHVTNRAVPFTVSPEVLSSNNISYMPSDIIINKNNDNSNDGEVVITTPGGYIAEFTFPAENLLERYNEKNTHLSTINDLILYIPAITFDDNDNIGLAPNLLMIKKSEYQNFFEKNKVPDGLSSFTGVYDSVNKRYYFSSLRNYFIELLGKGQPDEEDVTFVLVPVEIETETSNNYYSDATYVTKCVPYSSRPSMTLLQTDKSIVTFSFSTQFIE